MLLWAETNYDRGMWVNALKAIMQSTGPLCLQNFQVRKTKKNKFVVELMESLKESYKN